VCRNVAEGYELGRLEYPNGWDSAKLQPYAADPEKKAALEQVRLDQSLVAVLLNLVLRFSVVHALH